MPGARSTAVEYRKLQGMDIKSGDLNIGGFAAAGYTLDTCKSSS